MSSDKTTFIAGVDVGSTTVKIVLADPSDFRIVHRRYERHYAEQADTVLSLLTEAHQLFPNHEFRLAVCGSGGQKIAEQLGAFYTQEVVSNGIVIRNFFPEAKTAIELGGQDAKIIFFSRDEKSRKTSVSDMRMNGVCAGGTGAFIDQIADLLKVSAEDFGQLAEHGTRIYEISGRCGVFAKTDIQPLLNQGASRADIALSAFHAIARQIIGGLAQGREIRSPVIFEGGPMTFQPALVRVFREWLNLDSKEGYIPEGGETIVALGAAISTLELYGSMENRYRKENLIRLENYIEALKSAPDSKGGKVFFDNHQEREEFQKRFQIPAFVPEIERTSSNRLHVYLGIDAGSTTSKFVLLNKDGSIADKFYRSNNGDPLKTLRDGLLEIRQKYRNRGIELDILGAGSTGYGETLVANAFNMDYHTVETVAHTRAAVEICPDVSFILDIGGQDMKAIFVERGVPVNFILNEACSAGCGSFLETYAQTLNIPIDRVATTAFDSDGPSRLGSRCTVFMNSAVITEQKNGRSLSDIMAGLCQSVVENALTKVLRISNPDVLGKNIVVQGGTFRNDAVLRAFEQKIQRNIIRPAHPGEMGAIGIALLTKEHMEDTANRFPVFSWEKIEKFSVKTLPTSVCGFCSNSCQRTILEFSENSKHVTGNRCEKGEILDEDKDVVREKLRKTALRMKSIADLPEMRERLIVKEFVQTEHFAKTQIIGIPRSLEFWDSLPFWKAFFNTLGYRVIVSSPSTPVLFESALQSVSSDTICLPAKLAHGHVHDLIEKKVDRIFHPLMMKGLLENSTANASWMCPVIQGYSEVVRIHDDPEGKHGIQYDKPAFQWDSVKARDRQILKYARSALGEKKSDVKRAIEVADEALRLFRQMLVDEGEKTLAALEPGEFAVVMAGRPYHNDSFINHDVAKHFRRLGIPVLDLDSLPGLAQVDLGIFMMETNNVFHSRLLAAGYLAAQNPYLELVQIVSFGCGHDAVLSDELVRVMAEAGGKSPLILKLDESENRGPIGIRVRSFVETIKKRRAKQAVGV